MHFDFKKLPGKELQRYNFTKLGDPKISIIMPFYNDAANIKQTINSVLNQTYGSFELVIVNDGSTDKNSLKILEELKKLDNRIKIFTKKMRAHRQQEIMELVRPIKSLSIIFS